MRALGDSGACLKGDLLWGIVSPKTVDQSSAGCNGDYEVRAGDVIESTGEQRT